MQPRSVADNSSPSSSVKQEDRAGHMRGPSQSSPRAQNVNGYPRISMSPFSTSLPAEAQMLLGSALDPHDPMTAMMMAGSENLPQPWNYNNPMSMKQRNGFHQGHDGMSATLAPSALDMSNGNRQFSSELSSTSMASSTNPGGLHLGAFDNSMNDFSKNQMYGGNSSTASGIATPRH